MLIDFRKIFPKLIGYIFQFFLLVLMGYLLLVGFYLLSNSDYMITNYMYKNASYNLHGQAEYTSASSLKRIDQIKDCFLEIIKLAFIGFLSLELSNLFKWLREWFSKKVFGASEIKIESKKRKNPK